ncbi:FecR domain-containing protein [Spirochaetota bacterium]
MKRTILLILIIIIAVAFVSAADVSARVTEIAGKVEYSLPGKDWKPAKVGDVLPKGTLISTGFKSTAILAVGNSTITVKPITRLSLEELIESTAGSQTQLFLLAGRVKADVAPEEGKITEFQVKSPTATASVRGTSFEFDGINLLGLENQIQLITRTGMRRTVSAGEFAYVSMNGSITPPVAVSAESGLERINELVDIVEAETRTEAPQAKVERTATVVIILE